MQTIGLSGPNSAQPGLNDVSQSFLECLIPGTWRVIGEIMDKNKEIIRLHERGSTYQEISAILRCSTKTVSKVLKAAKSRQVGYEELAEMDPKAVRQLLFDPPEQVSAYYQPDYAKIEGQMRLPGVNLSLLWDEYARAGEEAGLKTYGYSWFCERYAKWSKSQGRGPAPTMRIRHVPGRLMEVDWCGDRAAFIDAGAGEVIDVFTFVACLPYSKRIYAEAFLDMRQASWTDGHLGAFSYFGGTTELLTPDNCKTGVNKPSYYDPTINRDYAEMARHYDIAILPARPHRPKDKASVETSVKLVETWVLAYLRNSRFLSLAELNQAIRARVDEINAQPLRGLDYSRDDVFYSEEQGCLRPLPAAPYEQSEWRRSKVAIDYCIQVERQRYSVPHHLIGQQVDVRMTKGVIEVFKDNVRVCSHVRLTGRFNQYSIQDEHMPERHRLYNEEWNPDRFRSWATSVGPSCLSAIESILSSKPHPAQTYRACLGVMGYSRTEGNAFLERVCADALAVSRKPTYGQIKELAQAAKRKGKAKPAQPGQARDDSGIGSTGMVRGADYYRLD